MRFIKLTRGFYATVDDEDYDFLNSFSWYAKDDVYTWYAVRESAVSRDDRRQLHMHRLLMFGGDQIDHMNLNGLDNRKDNLRFATLNQNRRNRLKCRNPTTSQFKGVCWDMATGKWRARVNEAAGKERLCLGYFNDEIDAAKAYDAAAIREYGEFARLNFSS